jgi:hypothetical protein
MDFECETYAGRPGRPHLVVTGGEGSAAVWALSGIGESAFVPLA